MISLQLAANLKVLLLALGSTTTTTEQCGAEIVDVRDDQLAQLEAQAAAQGAVIRSLLDAPVASNGLSQLIQQRNKARRHLRGKYEGLLQYQNKLGAVPRPLPAHAFIEDEAGQENLVTKEAARHYHNCLEARVKSGDAHQVNRSLSLHFMSVALGHCEQAIALVPNFYEALE